MTAIRTPGNEPIGFIGVGRMGAAMAERLLAAGHPIIAHDTNDGAVAALVVAGATRANSPAAVASAARVVLASLPTPQIVLNVVRGTNGVRDGTAVRTFVDLSTSGAAAAIVIDRALHERGIQALDAPVSGGIAGARAGTLALMVSGPRQVFEEVEPVLKHLGRLFFVGEKPGLGQTLKLANNLMSQAAIAITAEALAMGVKAGVDPQLMLDVINASSGRNTASSDKFPKHVLTRGFDFGFSTGLALKDVRLCLEEAAALGVPMNVGAAVQELLAATNQRFGADSDCTCVARTLEERAGCEISSKRGSET
ncbi:MAG TPA: NAD(P)-dependent oxidoreductase [Steroidobacteraceae bacterium]|nr:NAD(P)-dependent oxidoreductase [Steroidobacteraceae bacterium]